MAISVVGETAGSQSTHLLRHLREIKRPFRSSLFNPHLHRSASPFLIIALVLTRSCTLAYSTWDFPRWLRGCLLLWEIQCNPKCFHWLKETNFGFMCLNQRAPNKQLYGQKAYLSFNCHKLTLHSDEISFYVSNIWIAYEILPVCCLCVTIWQMDIHFFNKGIYNFRHHIHLFINSIIYLILYSFVLFYLRFLYFISFMCHCQSYFFIIYHLSP